MKTTPTTSNIARRQFQPEMLDRDVILRLAIFTFITCTILLLILWVANKHESGHTVFTITNYLGPVTLGLHETGRMVMWRQGPPYVGRVPFFAARMPFPIYFLLLLHKSLRGHYFAIKIAKTLLLILPIFLSVWISLAATPINKRNLVTALLFVPFLTTSFLLLATTVQVEEAFFYSFMACALSIVLYFRSNLLPPWLAVVICILCVDLTYLTKSSTRVACCVLVIGLLLQLKSAKLRALLCVFTIMAPLLWGSYLFQTTGRFSIGDSLDGFNFHKGNYTAFLTRYPPADNGYMDRWDYTIIPSTPTFHTEWEDNEYHTQQGLYFIRRQPGEFARGVLTKFYVYFLSLRDIGSGHKHDMFSKFDLGNMLLFRAVLLGSIVYSIWNILRGKEKFAAYFYIFFVLSAAAPFLIGFALTRQATILIFPSVIALSFYVSVSRNADSNSQTPA